MGAPDNTKTSITNMALSHIKQRTIASFDEASEQARKAAIFYDPARREALRACYWNFATANKALTLIFSVDDATFDPTFATLQDIVPGWLYTYGQPANCLAVRKLYNPQTPDSLPLPYIDRTIHDRVQEFLINNVQWRALRSPKGNVPAIVTNLKDAWSEFTYDITDESQFDDAFVKAFSFELACELCLPLTGDKELLAIVEAKRDALVGEAKRHNGAEGTEHLNRVSNYEAARD